MIKKKIILDVDTGVDDVLAILLAAKSTDVELLAITAVAGNVELKKTLENSLKVIEIAGRSDIPVAAGCSGPLTGSFQGSSGFHGLDGLNDLPLSKSNILPVSQHAVDLIIDKVHEFPGQVTIAAVGPLTNIASAVTKDPGILPLIKEIILMGGAAFCPGNVTPFAEFNIWADPEAARRVFLSGAPITMVGLDVTQKTLLQEEDVFQMIHENNTPAADFINKLLRPDFDRQKDEGYKGVKGFAMHDPLIVGCIIDPLIIKKELHFIDVETKSCDSLGMTIVDRPNVCAAKPNVNVAISVDASKFIKLFKETLGRSL